MKKVKIAIITIITFLALIIFLQNTETVETKVLSTSITMPLVLLLMVTFMTGFVVGIIMASHFLRKSANVDKSSKKI